MDLGSRIKAEREKLNLSQDDLAEKKNISRQAISKWETGTSYPDIEKILRLSEIFSLSLDELVKGDKSFQAGASLDVVADLFFLAVSDITLSCLGLLPPWFCGFLFLKFIEFTVTSKYVIRHRYSDIGHVFILDKFGRVVSALFFVVPGAACAFYALVPGSGGFAPFLALCSAGGRSALFMFADKELFAVASFG